MIVKLCYMTFCYLPLKMFIHFCKYVTGEFATFHKYFKHMVMIQNSMNEQIIYPKSKCYKYQ